MQLVALITAAQGCSVRRLLASLPAAVVYVATVIMSGTSGPVVKSRPSLTINYGAVATGKHRRQWGKHHCRYIPEWSARDRIPLWYGGIQSTCEHAQTREPKQAPHDDLALQNRACKATHPRSKRAVVGEETGHQAQPRNMPSGVSGLREEGWSEHDHRAYTVGAGGCEP